MCSVCSKLIEETRRFLACRSIFELARKNLGSSSPLALLNIFNEGISTGLPSNSTLHTYIYGYFSSNT